MKILFYFTSPISPQAGGVERVAAEMYKWLTKYGYDITTIYLYESHENYKTISNQIKLPSIKGLSKINEDFIKELIIEKRFDIALNFAAIFNKSSRAFINACAYTGLPVISIYHNTLDWPLWANRCTRALMSNNFFACTLTLIYRMIQKSKFRKNANYISRLSTASVVLSPCYINQYKKLIDGKPKRLLSIRNPLTLCIPNKILWKDKKNTILFVGRLEQQKNLESLLRIWAATSHEGWVLKIVGSGSREEHLRALSKNLQLDNSVMFEKNTNDPAIFYKEAKAFVMTSYFEGYPMTLIECQAYGCVPVIFDSYPAAKEIIRNNYNGYLIDKGDEVAFSHKLEYIMNEGCAELRTQSENCVTESESYSPEIIMKQWINLIEQCAK